MDPERLKGECLARWLSVKCPEMDETLNDAPYAYWRD